LHSWRFVAYGELPRGLASATRIDIAKAIFTKQAENEKKHQQHKGTDSNPERD